MNNSEIYRIMWSLLGGVMAVLEPTVPYCVVCTLAVLFDCYTAWSLGRRVRRRFPDRSDGKLKSTHLARVFMTLIKVYALIILAHLIDKYIVLGFSMALPNIVAGAVCFWQIWSMLENEASCNDAKWARVAQRILVDKTERHFGVSLTELRSDDKDTADADGGPKP